MFMHSFKLNKQIAIAALFSLFLVGCGGDGDVGAANGENTDTLALDFSDMNEMSLEQNGLNMKIMLPSVASSTGASIDPEVEHEDGDYLWYVNIGPRFQLIIEDFGREKNKVQYEKKRLSDLSKIFTLEYIVDEPTLIMYRRDLHEGQGGKPSYHCYGEVVIDGYTYVLRSEEEGSLKPIIEDMVKTIRSAAPLAGA